MVTNDKQSPSQKKMEDSAQIIVEIIVNIEGCLEHIFPNSDYTQQLGKLNPHLIDFVESSIIMTSATEIQGADVNEVKYFTANNMVNSSQELKKIFNSDFKKEFNEIAQDSAQKTAQIRQNEIPKEVSNTMNSHGCGFSEAMEINGYEVTAEIDEVALTEQNIRVLKSFLDSLNISKNIQNFSDIYDKKQKTSKKPEDKPVTKSNVTEAIIKKADYGPDRNILEKELRKPIDAANVIISKLEQKNGAAFKASIGKTEVIFKNEKDAQEYRKNLVHLAPESQKEISRPGIITGQSGKIEGYSVNVGPEAVAEASSTIELANEAFTERDYDFVKELVQPPQHNIDNSRAKAVR